jgi:DNA-binding CsgD family transcriptional regulator
MDKKIMADNHNASLYNRAKQQILTQFCHEIFQNSDISVFGYRKFFLNNTYIALCTNNAWQDYYFDNVKNIGEVFTKAILNVPLFKYSYFIWPNNPNADYLISALHYHNIWNGITLYYRSSDYIESFAFGGKVENYLLQDYLVNNLHRLENFIIKFKYNSNSLISSNNKILAKFNNSFVLPNVNNYDNKSEPISKISTSAKFSNLTSREIECVFFILKGYSNKKIANLLGISSRTVEIYLDKVRQKTHSHSRADLIGIVQHQPIIPCLFDKL